MSLNVRHGSPARPGAQLYPSEQIQSTYASPG